MDILDGVVRNYAWGSRTALAAMRRGPVPSPYPEAELWLGAHPADSAHVRTDDGPASLLEVVHADPDKQLGLAAGEQFGDRLPYLLKLLAADEPLSLQAHPSRAQAEEGFAREEAAGVPLDSPVRNYKDPSHKPELLVALGDFEALAGFRSPERTVELLTALDVAELAPYVALLAGQPDSDGLRALFTTWITLPPQVVADLMPRVLDGCIALLAREPDGPFTREARTALQLAESYPGDTGVLASLLLNRLSLEAGQGLYLGAGNLHAYLHGVGVEIMANSDNVLRGGLTPKHVDVPELLRVLDFDALESPLVEPRQIAGTGQYVYDTPAPEFVLTRIELDGARPSVTSEMRGPRILVCTEGDAQVCSGGRRLDLPQGCAAWVAATDPVVTLDVVGDRAQVFEASVAP
ncbi:mannose-6-phosphate isomerase, class I [Rhodococcus sp. HNM0569]|uniref:mannose-6-phosphate isomerase, class I n=1 Tax=Rhodococcus sp. HNM0569 TaxID=2716340 RepID=UPI00146DBC6F|nr:mannose-6-phosphate isomerase, class I [Rhodococcus sp. HNM0569]